MYFAWQAGKNPAHTAYATANMTGANRLLIGLGWATVVIAFWLETGTRVMTLGKDQKVKVVTLAIATLYSLSIPFKETLSIIDSLFLLALFIMYMVVASRAHVIEPKLEGPSAMIARFTTGVRRTITLLLFAYSGLAIFTAA